MHVRKLKVDLSFMIQINKTARTETKMMWPQDDERTRPWGSTETRWIEHFVTGRQTEVVHQSVRDSVDLTGEGEERNANHIEMSFINAVPSTFNAGCVMGTPVVILLSRGVRCSTAMEDVWVFVSLIDGSSGTSERDDLLEGRRADNAHPLLGYVNQTDNNLAYASFSDLLVSKPGKYRFRVTAIDMRCVHISRQPRND